MKTWRTVVGSSPLGDPFYAHPTYMSVFCVLEVASLGRLTNSELDRLAARSITLSMLCFDEQRRRDALS